MFKKISIISNFNVENFKNILSNFKKNYNVKTFSNSLIISDLKKNKNSDLIIVLIDKNNRSDSFKKFFFDYVKRNKNIIFFSFKYLYHKIKFRLLFCNSKKKMK